MIKKLFSKKMQIFQLLFFLIILVSCSESTNIPLKLPKTPDGKDIRPATISWKDFHKYCGPQNLSNTVNFMKIKDLPISWEGKVYAIREDDYVKNNSGFSPKIIQLKMAGTDSVLSDVTLRLPPDSAKIYDALKKDDSVYFRGRIAYLGSTLNDHVVIVEKFKKK